jgi:hypothetical protein
MLNRPEKFQHLWKILWKFRGDWGRRIPLYEYLERSLRIVKKKGESPSL